MSFRFFGSLGISLLLFFLLFSSSKIRANYLPASTGYVNDFAGVLTEEQKRSLEDSLKKYDQETGNEIAVAIIKSLDGQDINDFAVRVFEEWKVGKQGKDNGILLLVAIEERKVRIEVGYGLEFSLTDGQAGEIIRNVTAPEFQKSDYYTGLNNAVLAIKEKLGNSQQESTPPARQAGAPWSAFALIVILQLVVYLLSFMARSRSFWLGGIAGGVLGGVIGLILRSWFGGLSLVILLGGLGLFLDWILSRNYQLRKAAGKTTGWWGSWGGFSGSRSNDGFGGFGGGRSGGGGASGGW